MGLLACLCAALVCWAGPAWSAQAQAAPQQQAEEPAVARWKGTLFSGAELTKAIGEHAAAAVRPWSAWARANGYELEFTADLRLLFLHSAQRKASPRLALISRTLESLDKLVPPTTPAPESTSIPVVVELEGPKDFALLLDDVGKRHPYLEKWAHDQKQQLGFLLEDPLAAAFLAKAPDVQEWNQKNELVNRSAQLALFARFGRLPHWLTQGLAWQIEMSVCDSIFCFPFRSGFVAKKEHKNWAAQLKSLTWYAEGARGAPDDPTRDPNIQDLAGWARGTFENNRALLAWGAATFLAKKRPAALPLILEDLRALREKESRITKPDGTWEIDPPYEVPPQAQQKILEQRAGADFFQALAAFCRGN